MRLYLTARQLRQVGLELLTDHRVDGHQAEHTGLANTALCVVVALQADREKSVTDRDALMSCTHKGQRIEKGLMAVWYMSKEQIRHK